MKRRFTGWVDWLLNNPPKRPEDLNARLIREANETEKRAVVLEEEVKLRKRLTLARERCAKAKREMGTKQLYSFKLVLIAVVVVGVFFLMLKNCGGA